MSEALRALHEEQHSRVALTLNSKAVVSSKFPQYLAAFLATLLALSAGTALAWSSPALPLLGAGSHLPLTAEQGSWVGSLLNLGAAAGALPAGPAADRLGRRGALLLLAPVLAASWLAVALADAPAWLYGARLVAGMAVGAVSVATPMYVAEVAEAKVRGALGTLFQLQMTLGVCVAYGVGLLEDFHVLAWVCAAVPLLFVALFFWMPESPVFLAGRGRPEEAKRALQRLRGPRFDAEDELTRMLDAVLEDKERKASVADLFRSRASIRALVIALGLMFFQQMSGVNAVVFYTGEIFRTAGSHLHPSIATIIVGAVMVVSTYASTLLVDRAGRRALLLISSTVMAACLATLGGYFFLQTLDTPLVDPALVAWVPVASVAIFVVVFSLGFGPLPWMMLGELFPPATKGAASALVAGFSWLLAFTVTKAFQTMVALLGIDRTFWVFSGLCLLGVAFVGFLVPETKGKDLEEIQAELGGRGRQAEAGGGKGAV